MTSGRPLVAAEGAGPLLRLTRPISFWGGVDPVRGVIADPRHPQYGASIADTVLLLPAAIGSSSSSAIMLELMRERLTPAAILMGEADAILALGVIVGRELGYPTLPVVEVELEALAAVESGRRLRVNAAGEIGLEERA